MLFSSNSGNQILDIRMEANEKCRDDKIYVPIYINKITTKSLQGPPAAAHEDRDVRVVEHTLEIVDLRTGIRIAGEEVAGSLDPLKCDQDQAWGLPGFGLLPDDRVALPSS